MGYYEKKAGIKYWKWNNYTPYYYYTFKWVKDFYYFLRRKTRSFKYGFDIMDSWDLDDSMAMWLYPRLMYLKDNTHGWPSHKYETYEEWINALEICAKGIEVYLKSFDTFSTEKELVAYENYRESMKFIYENLGDLWD